MSDTKQLIARYEPRLLRLILLLFVLLGWSYALTTPVFEASDELWHYPLIKFLADGNPLPVQAFDPDEAGPWKQQASQPPLYYWLAAATTFWIDTDDLPQVRWLNPHVDNGIITTDGNINLVVHDPNANPWQGTLLAVRVIRVLSVLLGACTVYLTYRIAREVAPNRPEIALGAAAINAFTPMFLFISGAVNNDNLVVPLASLALLLMIRLVRSEQSTVNSEQLPIHHSPFTIHHSPFSRLLLLGLIIGLAGLTKVTALGLLALAWGTIFIWQWQRSDQQVTLKSILRLLLLTTGYWLLVTVPFLLVAGWWYVRNIRLYGDLLGWNAFIAVLGQRESPASLAQLWDERHGFLQAFWGLFGGVNVPMTGWIYTVLNGLLVVGVVGFVVYLIQETKRLRDWRLRSLSQSLSLLISLVARFFPLVICLLWAAAIVYGLIQWTTITWSSQGRLVFTAISVLMTMLTVGLVGWMPQKIAGWVVGVIAVFMLAVAAASPFVYIRPAYQPPSHTPEPAHPVNITFGNQMRLTGYDISATTFQPGDEVDIWLAWDVLAEMEQDWSVFVHLSDPVLELPIAQRDMYFGQGLRATRLLQPGQHLIEHYHVTIPQTAIAPAELQLVVGLYQFGTNNRLRTDQGLELALLTPLQLEAIPGELPNPVGVNFGDEVELVGFTMEPRRVRPGETVALTLYWRALRPQTQNYTFFAQVVGDWGGANERYAAADIPPEVATSAWSVGEVQTVTLPLTLRPDTPAEAYPIIIGLYTQGPDGSFNNVQRVDSSGRILNEAFLNLTPIRVDN
ncbi:MAG: glycosyltransferase family 39 protein [Candidatus Promineifilaceae bacterium]